MKTKHLLNLAGGLLLTAFGFGSAHAQTYCSPPTSNCGLDDEIINVTFAGINNTTGCTAGYGDYTAGTPATVSGGVSYPISVTVGEGGNEAIGAWIDYDHNGTFEASEYTYIGNVSGGTANATIVIPASATAGSTRMRIRSFYIASGDPATYYNTTTDAACVAISTNFGETEDYTVVIAAATDCAGVPATLTISSAVSTACASTVLMINTDNAPENGQSYQWQSSTDGGTTWNNLGAAQASASYNATGQTVTTQYRVTLTCTNGGATVTSNALTITQNAISACVCQPVLDCTDNDMITNVTFVSINNNSTCGTDGYSDYTAMTAPALTASQTYPISVTVGDGWAYESVSVWIDYNHNGVFEAGEFTYIGTGSASVVTGSITVPSTALPGDATMRVRVAAVDVTTATDDMACDEAQEYGETEDYTVSISLPAVIDSVVVTTQGNVPATIATPTGTLQVVATVYPLTSNQDVTWSIVNATGTATISQTGLVTAQTAGTVWAKAVSDENTAKKDSILITINPWVIDSVVVATQGNVPATIATPTGTLQLVSTVYPLTTSQDVTWSIVNATGTATISQTGLVTAQTAGTVWAKAVSDENAAKKDSILITINPLVIAIDSVVVTTQGNVPATIATPTGTLQVVATVYPLTSNQDVTWSIVNATGTATISQTGLVSAQTAGTVWAKAVSDENTAKKDSILITINPLVIGIDSVVVTTLGNVPAAISTQGGTLQLQAQVYPLSQSQNVIWTISNGTGSATIATTGLVTALTNGNVWAKATSVQNTAKKDSILIVITNQDLGIADIFANEALSVFPNPTSDVVTLKTGLKHAALSFRLTDAAGNILSSGTVKENELNEGMTIDLAPYAPGLYFITLEGSETSVTQRVVRK